MPNLCSMSLTASFRKDLAKMPTPTRYWVCTSFDRDWCPEKLSTEQKREISYICWKPEELPHCGWHQHAYVEFKSQTHDKTAVSERLGQMAHKKGDAAGPSAHNEPRLGTQAQAVGYVASDEWCHACGTGDCRQATFLFDEPHNLKPWHPAAHNECRRKVRSFLDASDGSIRVEYQCELKGTRGDMKSFGALSQGVGRPSLAQARRDAIDYERAQLELAIAQCRATNDARAAIDHLIDTCPMMMATKYRGVTATLNHAAKPRFEIRKFPLPDMSMDKVKLWPWQQELWDLLKETPQPQRIIWVAGDYDSGKSFMYNYIHSNYQFGAYGAGLSACCDSVVYGYHKEGVVMWDLPRCFDYGKFGDSIGNIMAKFSDVGQFLSSKKYKGHRVQSLAHVIVFAAAEPMPMLQCHTTVVRIKPQKLLRAIDEPEPKRSRLTWI